MEGPKSRWWDCVYKDIKKCKINRWNVRSKDREDWKRLVEEAKVYIGLQDHLRRRGRRRRRNEEEEE